MGYFGWLEAAAGTPLQPQLGGLDGRGHHRIRPEFVEGSGRRKRQPMGGTDFSDCAQIMTVAIPVIPCFGLSVLFGRNRQR